MERYEIGAGNRLSELVDAALRGEEAVLVRDGVAVAEIRPRPVPNALPAKPFDLAALEALRARLPLSPESGADLVRELRDSGDW